MPDAHRDYFNRLAPKWDRMAPREPRLKEYLVRFGVAEGDRVLDVGAGSCRTTDAIRDRIGPSGCVVALDLAESMLFEAKKSLLDPHILFLCSDVHELPVRNDSFDRILCYSVFPHFQNPHRALCELHRVLKADGKLLILHSSSHAILNAFHASLDGPVQRDRLPSPEEMRSMLEASCFHVIRADEAEDLYWVEAEKAPPILSR